MSWIKISVYTASFCFHFISELDRDCLFLSFLFLLAPRFFIPACSPFYLAVFFFVHQVSCDELLVNNNNLFVAIIQTTNIFTISSYLYMT